MPTNDLVSFPFGTKHVLNALLGRTTGPFTQPLRDVLRDDRTIIEHLSNIQRNAELPTPVSTLRALDVIVWMANHGDQQVSIRQ